MMPAAVATIWIISLIVIAVVIVPVAVTLLRRVLNAAWAIEAYLADMKASGMQIAGHTAAIPALDDTLATAAAMQPVASAIEARTGAVAALLSQRASRRANP